MKTKCVKALKTGNYQPKDGEKKKKDFRPAPHVFAPKVQYNIFFVKAPCGLVHGGWGIGYTIQPYTLWSVSRALGAEPDRYAVRPTNLFVNDFNRCNDERLLWLRIQAGMMLNINFTKR